MAQCDVTEARQLLVLKCLQARSRHQDVHPKARTPEPLDGQDTSSLPCFSPVKHVESDVHEGALRAEFVRISPLPHDEASDDREEEATRPSVSTATGMVDSIMEVLRPSGQPTKHLVFQPLSVALLQEFRWGPQYLSALLAYMASIEWDVERPESTCTWIEIALDFESSMHMLLPPSGELTPKFDSIGRNTATLISRARSIHNMCLVLERGLDKASGSHKLCTPLMCCWALSHLGMRRSAGVKPRPVLVAPRQVYTVLSKFANDSASGTGLEQGGQSTRPAHVGRVTEWIPQPRDQLLPAIQVTAQIRAMQQAQPALLARLRELGQQSRAASSAELNKQKAADEWNRARAKYNALGPKSCLHLLRPEHGHLEQQHCALCMAAYWHHNRAKALTDACPRAKQPGFEQAWNDAVSSFTACCEATSFPPHQFASTPIHELEMSEQVRGLLRDPVSTLPVKSKFDDMSLQEFAAQFPVSGFLFRTRIEGTWRAHQHNLRAASTGMHVLEIDEFPSGSPSISCTVCGATTTRKHLDRFKRRACPQNEADLYKSKWEASLRGIQGAVSKLLQAAPD